MSAEPETATFDVDESTLPVVGLKPEDMTVEQMVQQRKSLAPGQRMAVTMAGGQRMIFAGRVPADGSTRPQRRAIGFHAAFALATTGSRQQRRANARALAKHPGFNPPSAAEAAESAKVRALRAAALVKTGGAA